MRLSGPKTHVGWTPDSVPPEDRVLVTLVRESDLKRIEDLAQRRLTCEGSADELFRLLAEIEEVVRGEA